MVNSLSSSYSAIQPWVATVFLTSCSFLESFAVPSFCWPLNGAMPMGSDPSSLYFSTQSPYMILSSPLGLSICCKLMTSKCLWPASNSVEGVCVCVCEWGVGELCAGLNSRCFRSP